MIFAHSIAPFSEAIFCARDFAFEIILSERANLMASESLWAIRFLLHMGFDPTPKSNARCALVNWLLENVTIMLGTP